jgi:DNA polymerase
MQLVCIDFETFFDKDYTLSKMTTEAYVRDPRFKVHCLGARQDKTFVVPLINRDDDFCGRLNTSAVLAHHAQFDGLILSHHYGIRPAFWFDTLSMARLVMPHAKSHSLGALAQALDIGKKDIPYEDFKGVQDLNSIPGLYEKVAAGCAADVELTYVVFKKLLPYVPAEELRVIDLTIRMFTESSLRLDKDRLTTYLRQTQAEKEDFLRQLGVTKAELQSSAKFAALLAQLGVEPPTKPSPSNPGEQIFAFSKTDEGMKGLLEHENQTISALASARLGQKSTLGETRAQRLLGMDSRGALPVYLNYCGAHTTRWSGGDAVNWQNFTRGSEIRKSILAPEGYQLVVVDLSQIECRILNWLAGETAILEAFKQGRDLYAEGATRFYGREITRADKIERHLGKTLELGCGYGMGWENFQYTCRRGALGGAPIELTESESKAAVKSYRASHPAVTQLWKDANTVLQWLHGNLENWEYSWGPMEIHTPRILLPNGAYLDYSNLTVVDNEYATTTRKGTSKMYGAKLVENVVQALSRAILSQAMLKIAQRYRIALTCHDELVYLAKTQEAPEALVWGLEVMKTPPSWCAGIPLDAEGSYDVRYSK